MNLGLLLEMAADGLGDRTALGTRGAGPSYAQLHERAQRVGGWLAARGAQRVDLLDLNTQAVPLLLFGAGLAGVPFAPLNYRLADDRLRTIMTRTSPAVAVADRSFAGRIDGVRGIDVVTRDDFLAATADGGVPAAGERAGDPDDIAVLLFTSGTTGEPKAAVLRHRNLVSYIVSTVEFMGASADESTLVSVPPYHIAGISAMLSSVYAGRRVVQLSAFDPVKWVELVRDEGVTHAMVVPTMLSQILGVLEHEERHESGAALPTLRALSYGGGRMPAPVIERAMTLLPHVDFVNAYGLTETSSTIAVLDPVDHRAAWASDDPAVRQRMGSVGRPVPSVELEIRDSAGRAVPAGVQGEIWVRGDQVAGEYLDGAATRGDGWFPSNDEGYLDGEGYLFVVGRLDDVIVRGGENISPGEIEDVLRAHQQVADAAVVGLPDSAWGEQVVAAVVLSADGTVTEAELQDWVRAWLRSSRTPERVMFRSELPYTDTGKLLRRDLRAQMLHHHEENSA